MIVKGARQVGKTYSILEFAQIHFEDSVSNFTQGFALILICHQNAYSRRRSAQAINPEKFLSALFLCHYICYTSYQDYLKRSRLNHA